MKYFFFRRLPGIFRGIGVLEMGRLKTEATRLLSVSTSSPGSPAANRLLPPVFTSSGTGPEGLSSVLWFPLHPPGGELARWDLETIFGATVL